MQENIRREIGQKVKEVDLVIDVLISAGMTSPALRTAQARDQTGGIRHHLPYIPKKELKV